MKNLVIIGAGGQGRETAQLVKDINKQRKTWDLLGYLDDNTQLTGKKFNGYPVLGSINTLKRHEFRNAFVTCAIGDSKIRKKVLELIEDQVDNLRYATLIHPTAVVGDETIIEQGTIVCANSVITTNVKIGRHVIVNYGSTIGHDTEIKDFVTVLPGSNVSGNVKLLEAVDIGSGVTIIPQIEIGAYSIVGAGAVVTKNLPGYCTAVGIPAKPIKYHK